MKLRRRFEELTSEVSRLTQQRELLLTQMADEQAEREKRQQVRWVVGAQPPHQAGHSTALTQMPTQYVPQCPLAGVA